MFCSGQVYTPDVSSLGLQTWRALNILVRIASVACILRKHTQHFRSRDIGLSGFRRHATTLGRASWNTQFDSDSSLACLADTLCGRFVPWLFSSLRDGVVRLLRTIVTWTLGSSVSATARSVSILPRWVETAVRLQGPDLALRPAQQFRGAPLISCVGTQNLGAHETWTMRLLSPGPSMLASAPKTPENEEHGAAIRSRRWCRRRPQSGICLHSLVPGHGRGHAKHSPMSATRILVMRSAGRFKKCKIHQTLLPGGGDLESELWR